jgi:hypothetical protein
MADAIGPDVCEVETMSDNYPLPWEIVHCKHAMAIIKAANGNTFTIFVQPKRHLGLKELVDQVVNRQNALPGDRMNDRLQGFREGAAHASAGQLPQPIPDETIAGGITRETLRDGMEQI